MRAILFALIQLLTFRFRRRASLELEVVALRHQLKVLRRRSKASIHHRYIRTEDRIFWVWLDRIWPQSLKLIQFVKPTTIVQWHRKRFKLYWLWNSHKKVGPKIRMDVRDLVLRFHRDNPLWGAGRMHGELLRVGYRLSEQTVLRYLKRIKNQPLPPSPTWRTFLYNHLHEAVSVDSFVVITATYKFLYAFIVLGLHRRKILHFEVTEHPTQVWISDQISKTFQTNKCPVFFCVIAMQHMEVRFQID